MVWGSGGGVQALKKVQLPGILDALKWVVNFRLPVLSGL